MPTRKPTPTAIHPIWYFVATVTAAQIAAPTRAAAPPATVATTMLDFSSAGISGFIVGKMAAHKGSQAYICADFHVRSTEKARTTVVTLPTSLRLTATNPYAVTKSFLQ